MLTVLTGTMPPYPFPWAETVLRKVSIISKLVEMFGEDGVIIIILLPESFAVLLSCINLNLTGIIKF